MSRLEELIAESMKFDAPRTNELIKIRPGGVDPLGLRQINFNLMDQFFPHLNNVARHIRPLTVMAWAWRCAWLCAEHAGLENIEVPRLREIVNRIEVIFVWSQLKVHGEVDLPGSAYLKSRLPLDHFTFSGDSWIRMQKERRNSTALSAPANYGPSLLNLCFVRQGERRDEIREHPLARAAIDSIDVLLGNERQHPVFSTLGETTVKNEDLERWGHLWSIDQITNAEREHIALSLGGEYAPPKRQLGIQLVSFAISRSHTKEERTLRQILCDTALMNPTEALQETVTTWRGIQARQLFRLALEALLFWTTRELGDRSRTLAQLANAFLSGTVAEPTVEAWLTLSEEAHTVDVVGPLFKLEHSLRGKIRLNELPEAIHCALRAALACRATDKDQRNDRLPLERAQTETEGFMNKSPQEYLEYVLSSWLLGQHVYWSVSRGIADARRGPDRILRLKIAPDELGWRLVPGSTTGAPRPTPDRLNTALCLLSESELLAETVDPSLNELDVTPEQSSQERV